jgi:hypothetical protein
MSQIRNSATEITEITEYTEMSVAFFVVACQLNCWLQRLGWKFANRIRAITFSVLSVSSVANKVLL